MSGRNKKGVLIILFIFYLTGSYYITEAARDYGDACTPVPSVLSLQTKNPDDAEFCDASRGLYCIPFSGTCGCKITGSIYRDGRCRARVNQQCKNFGAGKEDYQLDCVKNAICGNLPFANFPNTGNFRNRGYLNTNIYTGNNGVLPGQINTYGFNRDYQGTYSGVNHETDVQNYNYNSGGGSFQNPSERGNEQYSNYPGYGNPTSSNSFYYSSNNYYSRHNQPNRGYFPGGNGPYIPGSQKLRDYSNSNSCLCIPGYWQNIDGTVCNGSGGSLKKLKNSSVFHIIIVLSISLFVFS